MEKYLAFISYRHIKPDEKVSARLRRFLESFHLPASCPIPKRRKCFRDTDELPTSTDLGADIENALKDSRYLIAVCSEEYVKSRWCMQEITRFIEQGKKDRILPVLVSGTAETSIPEPIRDLPPVLDLRSSGNMVSRDQIPELLHRMSGTDASEIAAADRTHRILVRAGTFGGLAALLLGVIGYAYFSARQIEKNNEEIVRATQEAKEAETAAEQQVYDYYLKQSGYTAQKVWTLIRQGRDVEALDAAYHGMPWFTDTPDYAYALPDPVPLVDAMRAALAMPDRKRMAYSGAGSSYPWESLEGEDEVDQPEDLPFELTGSYPEYVSYIDPYYDELVTDYLLETTDPDGRFYHAVLDEYGSFPEADMVPADAQCRAAGYTRLFECPDGDRLLYGTDLPVTARREGEQDLAYCLDGDPFPADRIWAAPGGAECFVAQGPRGCALFQRDAAEAVSALPLEGEVNRVSYNRNREQIAVIDAAGRLSLFMTRDGSKAQEADGTFQDVTYANENYRLYAVTGDGEFRKMNALTMETERVYELPRPVKRICYCALADTWLVVTDCVSFCMDGSTGALLSGDFFWGDPIACYWEGFDEAGYTHGNEGFILICKDHFEVVHVSVNEVSPFTSTLLTAESLPKNVTHAFFNMYDDEEYIYLQYDNGDLSAWDIDWSDPSDWINRSGWGAVPEQDRAAAVSRDGTAIWRPLSNGRGVERIDAEYGGVEYRTNWAGECDASLIRESGDGWYALSLGMNGEHMILFDAESGERLWSREGAGNAVFSEDGYEILCLQAEPAPGDPAAEGERNLVFRRLDTETGDTLQEEILCTLEAGEAGDITIDQDTLTAVADGIWQIDLNELTALKLAHPPEPEPLFFAEQEVLITQEDGRSRLVSAQDGHLILDAGTQQMMISPSGDKVLFYGGDQAPYVIFAQDMGSLMDDAQYVIEDWQAELQEWSEYEIEDY